jgi:hypothetical protein
MELFLTLTFASLGNVGVVLGRAHLKRSGKEDIHARHNSEALR